LPRTRAAGPHAATYLGRLKESHFVKADQLARLARLVAEHGDDAVDLACRRALYYDAVDGAMTIERILERGLQHLPLPETAPAPKPDARDFGRPLEEYGALLERRPA